MKSTIIAIAALVASASAQNTLTTCLQGCNDRMNSASKAKELGCSQGDLKCLCTNPSFMFGFRDCANQACTADGSRQLLDAAMKQCQGAGVAIANGGSNGGSNGGNGGSSSANGGASSTAGGNGASSSNGGASATVSTIFSTISSDGTVRSTPVATTTIGGGEDDGGDDGSAVVTTITSNGSAIVSTITSMSPGASSDASGTGSSDNASSTEGADSSSSGSGNQASSTGSGNSASSTSGSGTHSSSSSGLAGPQMTAAPAAGVLAAVGIAALLI
ncbi:hypothetical protein HIM_00161 [Hirsutella minnesotensis 3608]|nr:hypothetical protein HIM_00161 [Hirsutella minnesotensis 3608]